MSAFLFVEMFYLVVIFINIPFVKGRDTPSPSSTPYSCRQRNSGNSIAGNMQEMNEMEKGVLLQNGNPSQSTYDYYSGRSNGHESNYG